MEKESWLIYELWCLCHVLIDQRVYHVFMDNLDMPTKILSVLLAYDVFKERFENIFDVQPKHSLPELIEYFRPRNGNEPLIIKYYKCAIAIDNGVEYSHEPYKTIAAQLKHLPDVMFKEFAMFWYDWEAVDTEIDAFLNKIKWQDVFDET